VSQEPGCNRGGPGTRRIGAIMGGRRSNELGLKEEKIGERLETGRRWRSDRRVATRGEKAARGMYRRAGGGGVDSRHRTCMCKKSAGRLYFPRKFSTLLVLSSVYYLGRKAGSEENLPFLLR
jgi:hypothetical protein